VARRVMSKFLAGCVLAGCVLAAGTACTNASASSAPPHPPAPSATASPSAPPPAALAGGACLLLNYDVINSALGTQFDVAAAADRSGTYTCVVQGSVPYPDLTLSITATTLTPANFTADVKPSGATTAAKLGKIGYSTSVPATSTAGSGIEVGWLSGNDRLIIMRYTAATGATASDPTGMVSLARAVDATTV
jgi:hypothetical protein